VFDNQDPVQHQAASGGASKYVHRSLLSIAAVVRPLPVRAVAETARAVQVAMAATEQPTRRTMVNVQLEQRHFCIHRWRLWIDCQCRLSKRIVDAEAVGDSECASHVPLLR
jgi:hypothetical protein